MDKDRITAIILAGGLSTRCYPLTRSRPKPLLPVANVPLLALTVKALRKAGLDKIIAVAHFKADLMTEMAQELKIDVTVQENPLGSGDAVLAAAGLASSSDHILILNGDDIYSVRDIRKMISSGPCILVAQVQDPSRFGLVSSSEGTFQSIIEKPDDFDKSQKHLVFAGAGLYPMSIFDILRDVDPSSRNEIEFTDALRSLSGNLKVIQASSWFPIAYPWDVLGASNLVMSMMSFSRHKSADIEKGAVLKGKVAVGKGSRILNGAYIEGPVVIGDDCLIGPNCYIRPGSCIGHGCHIGNAVEIKNSVVMDSTNIGHLSYVGDSVLGFGVNLGAGTIIANLRHDGSNVKSMVKGVLVDSGLRKLGAIIGDSAKTGINTSILPGRKLAPGSFTYPAQVVDKDVEV